MNLEFYNILDQIEYSKENILKAITDFKPYKICIMFSGGDDSLTVLALCIHLKIPIDFLIHANTGTGIKRTNDFVKESSKKFNIDLIESHPKKSFREIVIERGFYGNNLQAHTLAYRDLKGKPFRKAISENIRHRKRNRRILLLSGARMLESQRRSKTAKNFININPDIKSNIWVNLIHKWSKDDCIEFLDSMNVKRNPISKDWKHSGECNCGTTAKRSQLYDLSKFCPETFNMLIDIENEVLKKGFPWGWGMNNPNTNKQKNMEDLGQLNMFLCSGSCEMNRLKNEFKKKEM